jgi:hypothetical protein
MGTEVSRGESPALPWQGKMQILGQVATRDPLDFVDSAVGGS